MRIKIQTVLAKYMGEVEIKAPSTDLVAREQNIALEDLP